MSSCRTGKRRYRDETAARSTLAEVRRPGALCAQLTGRVYRCLLCAGWHLSTAPARLHRPM